MIVRLMIFAVAGVLLASGAVLGYIAVIALRRGEGVFLPAAYVAAACLVGGVMLGRVALRW